MARSRNIKPSFFKNYDLADLGPVAQVLFAGLWCLADREGRLEDKPRFIKAELFPYYDCDVNGELTKLERLGFVSRYSVDDVDVIQVLKFRKHQTPHNTEKASTLPEFDSKTASKAAPVLDNGGLTVNSRKYNDGKTPDSLLLIPDSGFLIADSLNPDSRTTDSLLFAAPPAEDTPPQAKPVKPAKPAKEPAPSAATWNAYAAAYQNRYRAPPVRNATVNGQLAQFVGRIGAEESPHVAAYYVGHQNRFYVEVGHSVGVLLRDAEKLRTEWATGQQRTSMQAIQADRTQTNFNAFAPLIAEAQAKEQSNAVN